MNNSPGDHPKFGPSPDGTPHPPDAPVMMHLHGFGLSGRYLLPTAEALADEFHILVPDLPGFGRSGNAIEPLTVEELAHAAEDRMVAARFEVPEAKLEQRKRLLVRIEDVDGPVTEISEK